MARNRDLGKLPFELKGGNGKTILTKLSDSDYDFQFRVLDNGDMPTGIDAAKIGAGTVSNTEFGYLDGVTSNIQTQINNSKGLKSGTATGTDTYAVTISGVSAYADGDAYLVRFTNGNTTTCTLNINSLGAIPLYRNNDGGLIGGDIVAGGEMLCVYNATGNYFQTIGTAPNTLLSYVTNGESITITKGQPVYAAGGTGDRMLVKLAYNTGDSTSAQTVGIVMADIAAGQKGMIIMQGLLDNLNILGSPFADGDTIYLGATAGSITKTKPYAPNHLVYLGVVTTASPGNAGRMYVRIQNGYELDELHNVQAKTPSLKDTLYYDTADSQWKTASIGTILGYTPVTNARLISTTSPLSGGGDLSADRTLSIAQATTSASGYLSSTDWNTFNGKQAALSGSGIVKSTGGTISYLTDNSANWDSAYTDRLKWDGGSTGLVAATGRTSLGATTAGSNLFTLTNPSAITFIRINADNSVSALDASTFRTAIGAGTGSGTVTSVAAITLGTSGTDLSSSVATGTTTPVITLNVPTASATNRGALSSADWSTFNGKQDALSGTGFVKISGTTISYDNSTYLTANQSIAFTASGDTSGTASGATSLSPSITVTGLRGVALPTLGASAGLLKYTGTGTNTWVFDTNTYLTSNQTITLSGDVSGSGTTAITATIGANRVTNSMLAQVSTATFKGRTTAGTGNVEDLTGTQATALLDLFSTTTTTKGLVKGSNGADNTNFLRADGTWAAPASGGSPGGSNTQIQYNNSGVFGGSANLVWDNTNTRLGIAQSTPTSRFHLNFNQNSVTQADANGILLANSTAAISGTQSISPAIVLQGNGYATTPAASQDVRFRIEVLPVQGSANPTATWRLSSSINNAAYANLLTYTSDGILSAASVIAVTGGTGLLNSPTQIFVGASSTTARFYRITNGGAATTPTALFGAGGSSSAPGALSLAYDATNHLVFLAGNGTTNVPRAGIQITNLTNFAGSETGDLIFLTQSGGTAISEKMRIFAGGNVGIGTGSTNGGFLLDVNGTGRFQNNLTTTGRVQATTTKSAAYTLTATDRVVFVTAASGYNITLPTAATGQEYTIVKTDNNANIITIATTGAAKINGANTYTGLAAQYKHLTVVFNGTDWFITSSN